MGRGPAVITLSLIGAILLAPSAAYAHNGDAVTMEGTLEFRHSDDFRDGVARYYYALEQGKRRVRLEFGRFRRDLRNGARLRVRGTLAHGRLSVERLRHLRRDPVRTFAATGPGPRRVAVLLVNFANDTGQPYTPAQAASTMFTAQASVSAYFKEESFGATSLSGDVFGWYTLPMSNAGCAIDEWARAANAAATAAGADLTSYQHVVYAFPFASSCGWAGLAEMPGSHVWINGSFAVRVLSHELSHNLGVHHAAALSCTSGVVRVPVSGTCSYNEYGDPFDVMGSGMRQTSSWHKGQIGWLDPLGMQTVTTSGTYTISPQEWASGGVQALRVARGKSGNYLYLEYRRPYGTSSDTFSVGDPVVNGVTIRIAPDYDSRELSYLIDTTSKTSSYTDAALAARQTFTDSAYGISIETTAVSATGATVQITLGSTEPPTLPPSADTVAPGAPGALRGQVVSGPAVSMSWSAATDNTGVTGYRVYRAGVEIGSGSGTTYTDAAPRAGSSISYSVRAYDAAGNLGAASNAFTVWIPSSSPRRDVPANRVLPTIAGTPQQGSTLTASVGAWNGSTQMTFAFRWLRCDPSGRCSVIVGAGRATYRVTARDLNCRLRLIVTASNGKASASATSAATATIRRARAGFARGKHASSAARTRR